MSDAWRQGRAAYLAAVPESDCPFDMMLQWEQWADWICGYGEAREEGDRP
jgi:hypothetical protein